jgi:hypothetical protein
MTINRNYRKNRYPLKIKGYPTLERIIIYISILNHNYTSDTTKEYMLANPRDTILISQYVLHKNLELNKDMYLVGLDLLTAINQSVLSVEYSNIRWLNVSQEFILPKNQIITPEQKSVELLAYYYEEPMLYWSCSDANNLYSRSIRMEPSLKNLFVYADKIEDRIIQGFNEYIHSLVIRLILITEIRPDLITNENGVVWLGKDYKLKTRYDDPKIQWKRGIITEEHIDSNKVIWREPTIYAEPQ